MSQVLEATVIAQCTALSVEMLHYCNSRNYLHFRRDIFRPRGYIVRDVISIGLAPLLMNLCTCVVVIFINKALLTYGGDIYVGAYGIVNRIVMLFIMMIGGLNQGMQPIVGYNYGARNYDRVQRALWTTVACAVVVMSVACALSQTIPACLFQRLSRRNDCEKLCFAITHEFNHDYDGHTQFLGF